QGATLLDVRTEAEWQQDGKPNGKELGLTTHFLSYLLDTENGRVVNDKFEETLNSFQIDKDKAVFVMCKSGARSAKVAMLLDQKGFKTFNVVNGFICSEDVEPSCWKTSGLPVL
ncbi:MAG: rhodanese-like domain-containing protein, partial [Pelagibacteraceae bacterium]